MNYSDMGWRYGIAGIFVITCCLGLGVTLLLYKRSRQRADAVADEIAEREWQALQDEIAEQAQHDQAARRILQLADTVPSLPVLQAASEITESTAPLPSVRPAYEMDHSDTSERYVEYCPVHAWRYMALDPKALRREDGMYPLPQGRRVLCPDCTLEWEDRITGDVL